MDIYAEVKYNKPEELSSVVNAAFGPVSYTHLSEPSKEKVKNDLLSIISELFTIAKKI